MDNVQKHNICALNIQNYWVMSIQDDAQVRTPSNSEYYTPSSELFESSLRCAYVHERQLSIWRQYRYKHVVIESMRKDTHWTRFCTSEIYSTDQ
jgi:predicted GNAT family acetyltransferase